MNNLGLFFYLVQVLEFLTFVFIKDSHHLLLLLLGQLNLQVIIILHLLHIAQTLHRTEQHAELFSDYLVLNLEQLCDLPVGYRYVQTLFLLHFGAS
jgi:hypothetical protein